jgi:hypothetical protein
MKFRKTTYMMKQLDQNKSGSRHHHLLVLMDCCTSRVLAETRSIVEPEREPSVFWKASMESVAI